MRTDQNLRVVFLSLALILFSATSLLAQKVRQEKNDTTIVLEGQEVIVEKMILHLNKDVDGYGRTLKSFALKNSKGRVLFSRDFEEIEIRENGFSDQFFASPSIVSTPGKKALLISNAYYPSAPSTGIDLQFFVWHDDSLMALSDPIDIYGSFGAIGRDQEQIEEPLSSTEMVLMTSHVAYHFYAEVPLIINLDPAATSTFRTPLSGDPDSDLKIIPVKTERRLGFMDEKTAKVKLYRTATGDDFSTVAVSRESNITVGPAYGTVKIHEKKSSISVKIKRLKVTIGNKTGFIGHPQDYQKIGLPAFG